SELNVARKLNIYSRNGLVAGIVLLSVIALLFINRLKIIHAQKQKAMAQERALVEKELAAATFQLQDFTRNLEEKNALIEQFCATPPNLSGGEEVLCEPSAVDFPTPPSPFGEGWDGGLGSETSLGDESNPLIFKYTIP